MGYIDNRETLGNPECPLEKSLSLHSQLYDLLTCLLFSGEMVDQSRKRENEREREREGERESFEW